MTQPKEVEVLTLKIAERDERFLLSAGGGQRIKERFKVKNFKEFLDHDVYAVGPPLLFEAMLDRPADLTEQQFANSLPGSIEFLTFAIMAVLGVSMPEEKDRPTSASATSVIQ